MSVLERSLEIEGPSRARREAALRAQFSLPRGMEPVELIGMGAFSEVWKARESSSGQFCALKRLRPERCDDPTGRQLIVNECQVADRVQGRHL